MRHQQKSQSAAVDWCGDGWQWEERARCVCVCVGLRLCRVFQVVTSLRYAKKLPARAHVAAKFPVARLFA